MPYQNLDSEIMIALAIWLLAILVFVMMLVVAVVEVISESRAKRNLRPKISPTQWGNLFNTAVSFFQRMKGN